MGLASSFFFFANVLPRGYPSPFRLAGEIDRFFTENRGEVRGLSAAPALKAVSLLAFAASATRVLGEGTSERPLLLSVALGGGGLGSSFVMLAAILAWTLPHSQVVADTSALRAVHDLTYLAGGPLMTLREWLLLLHIVAAMVWVGGSIVLNVLATRAVRSGDAEGIARFARDLRFVGPAILAPSVVLLLGRDMAFRPGL